jgi:RNA polymerase sigma factor (sigma-70 family)
LAHLTINRQEAMSPSMFVAMLLQKGIKAVMDICTSRTDYVRQKVPDRTLLEQAFSGDTGAFEQIVYRYQGVLYNFIGRILGDNEQAYDVLQFVFLQLYVSLPRLHDHLVSLRSTSPLRSWLFQVAWNRCVDELRRKRPVLFSELDLGTEEDIFRISTIPDPDPLPEEIAEQEDMRGSVLFAIQALPPRFRSVVLLRYKEELSFGEIGRRLNMPENTVKVYFRRALPHLRATLTQSAS